MVTSGAWTSSSSNQALGGSFLQSSDGNAELYWNVDIPEEGLYEVAVWFPQSKSFSSSTTFTVNSYTGAYPFSISQQSYGGRWYKLSDFYFVKGTQKLLSISGKSNSIVAANAIKISKWPECHDSPGATCQDFTPSGATCSNP